LSDANQGFKAHAFHPSLGTEVADGRIVFDQWNFRFESHLICLEIPYGHLQIEFGKAADEKIHFRNEHEPDWFVYTSDSNILEHRALVSRTHTRNQIVEARSQTQLKKTLVVTGVVLGICGLLIVCFSLGMNYMVRSIVRGVPVSVEQQYGDALVAELLTNGFIREDAKLSAQVTKVADPIVGVLPKSDFRFTFHAIEEAVPNAFAAPGGHIFVTTGLLDLSKRPEELAGVLTHEIAHVMERHSVRGVVSDAGPALIFSLFLRSGNRAVQLMTDSSEEIVQQSFSQKYELEADDKGWEYLRAARIDPRGQIDILKRLKIVEEKLAKKFGKPIQAFSSHPATDKRIKRLEAKWRKLKAKNDFVELPPMIETKPQ
jgi:Zn-dependent protease with chaperone function